MSVQLVNDFSGLKNAVEKISRVSKDITLTGIAYRAVIGGFKALVKPPVEGIPARIKLCDTNWSIFEKDNCGVVEYLALDVRDGEVSRVATGTNISEVVAAIKNGKAVKV